MTPSPPISHDVASVEAVETFKGTPGPWFWTEAKGEVVSLMASGGRWVADPQSEESNYGLSTRRWTDVSKEDADLIAAAPDLLEALQETVAWMVEMANSGDAGFWDPERTPEVIQARSAIDKALGGTA